MAIHAEKANEGALSADYLAQTFVIIGLVRPPRSKVDGGDVQQSLDLMGDQRPVAGLGGGLEAEEADALGGDEGDEPLD